ncbi:MAG: hypothetical protein JWP89_3696 [Schlesneria sp.]|nr:hypothetical protein [Schlesneria sp.]
MNRKVRTLKPHLEMSNLLKRRLQLIVSCVIVACSLGCGDTRLNSLIRKGDSNAVKKLLAQGKDAHVNVKGTKGRTGLHTAILAGNKDLYSLLLSHKADPNICDSEGYSVLHLAAELEDASWIREALSHGGNPDQLNVGSRFFRGETPIFYALSERRTATALALIEAGADVNHKSESGMRPIYEAYVSHRFEVMYKLLDEGADPNLTRVLIECGWDEEGDASLAKMVDCIEEEKEKQWYAKVNARLHEEGYLKENAARRKRYQPSGDAVRYRQQHFPEKK